MKKKNLALRMSACMMSALLVVGSAAPAYAAEDMAFVDQAADETGDAAVEESEAEAVPVEDTAEETTAEDTASEDVAEETETVADEADNDAEAEDAQSEDVDLEADDAEELTADEFSDEADDSAVVFADETAAAQTGFGTANTQLAAGTYQVTVGLKKADDVTADSMAASCIAGKATLVVAEDGSAKLTVPIQGVTMGGQTVYATDWKVYQGAVGTEATAVESTTDENGNVNSITFAIPDKAQDGVYVTMTVSAGRTQDAFVNVDYAKAEKDATAVDTSALEATIAQADALDEMSYTKESWDGNKDAIEAAKTAAKAALEKKESQEAVDAANTALTDAMEKLVAAGDQTSIKETLAKAKATDETAYSVKSWNYVKKAIERCETAIANRATQKELNSAESDLNFYLPRLVAKYDTTKLEEKIAEAEALKKEDYTTDSWKEADLTVAINTAKDAIENRGDKDAVNGALNGLETAMDKLVPVSNEVTVGRGSVQRKLAPGTYSLPVELLNGGRAEATKDYTSGNYMSQVSMAHGCFVNDTATLVIHEDGTATFTAGVQAIKAMGTEGAASDWTLYENTQDYLDGKANSKTGARFKARVDETKIMAGKRKPSKISFTIPDLKQNVVATNMYIEVMSVNQDACIGLDWANVEKVSDDTTATSDVAKEYVVKADTMTQLTNMKAGTTVKLDEDVTLTEDLTIKGGTLDLNGHALNQADNLIRIKGDVTIIDSSADKTGKITREKYFADTDTTTSISVQKGSLTAEGVAIDGQIGNKVANGDTIAIATNPRVSVTLTNCTLTNTVSTDENIAFEHLENGVDVTMDHCTADKGIDVGYGTGENVSITNSTVGNLDLIAAKAVVTDTQVTGRNAMISANDSTIKNDTFKGLVLDGSSDVVLENVSSTVMAYNGGALTVRGTGSVTIKGGVYLNNIVIKGYAISSEGCPVKIESGYFKGTGGAVKGAYTTPEGKILGDVTEGDYAGYQTVVDGEEPEVADPVMTIYASDGSVVKQISEENAALALSYANDGQTVKLNKDINAASLAYYKNCTFDLNGHVVNLSNPINGGAGTCHIIDSSSDKTGKIVSVNSIFASNAGTTKVILDNISCECMFVQGVSVGSAYVINGTKITGAMMIKPAMGTGATYVQDSTWTIAEKDYEGNDLDAKALLENATRTSQYTITQTGDRSFTVTVNDLGKAMRAFEAIDASQYTKASYAAAKAVYDEIDVSADEDIQGDVIAQKAKELNDAVAALQAPASEASINALKSAIIAAKKVKAADYTAASYKTYKAAITAAEKVLNGEDLSDAQVTEATKALTTAKTKLVKMKTQTITVSVKNTKNVVSKKYGDKAFSLGAKAKTTLSYKSSNTKIATVDSKGKVTIKAAGTVKITITAKATSTYKSATKVVTVKAAKAAPSIKTKVGSKTFTYAAVKKKAQAFTLGTSVNSKGKLSYKKLSGSSAIAVSSTGKFTVKKGLKKGTYRVKVRIAAAAKGNYSAGSRTVTITVKVK